MSDPHTGNTGKCVQDAIITPTVLEEFKSHQLYMFGIIKIEYIPQNSVLMRPCRLLVAALGNLDGRRRRVFSVL